MVKLTLEMKKRDVVWVSLVVVLISVGVVFAYGTYDATEFGHTVGEIDGLSSGGAFSYASSRSVTNTAIISAIDSITLSNLNVGDIVRAELSCSARAWSGTVTAWVELSGGLANVLTEPSQIRWISGMSSYYSSGGGTSVGLYEVTSAGTLAFSMEGSITNPGTSSQVAQSYWINCNLLAYTVN